MSNQPLKILVVRFSSLGDVILTSVFFRALRYYFPRSHVTFLSSSRFASVLFNNPYINDYIVYPDMNSDNLRELAKKINERKYDYIFDLHRSFRSLFLSFLCERSFFRIKKERFRFYLLIFFKYKNSKPYISYRQRYLNTLS